MDRGAELAREGGVTLGPPIDSRLEAQVKGSAGAEYEVELDWSWAGSRHVLWASCSCKDFQGGNLCRHLWATILAIDTAGLARTIPGRGALEILDDESADDESEAAADPIGPPILPSGRVGASGGRSMVPRPMETRRRPPAHWKVLLGSLDRVAPAATPVAPRKAGRRRTLVGPVWYLLNPLVSADQGVLTIDFYQRGRIASETNAPLRPLKLGRSDLPLLADDADRTLLALLFGGATEVPVTFDEIDPAPLPTHGRIRISSEMYEVLLPRLCATGRFGRAESNPTSPQYFRPLAYDEEGPWRLHLSVTRRSDEEAWDLNGSLRRGEASVDLSQPALLLPDGLVVLPDRIGTLDSGGAFDWVGLIRRAGAIRVPVRDRDEFLRLLWSAPLPPDLELPGELDLERQSIAPVPRIAIHRQRRDRPSDKLPASVWFDYPGQSVRPGTAARALVNAAAGRVILRDSEREAQALDELPELGFRSPDEPGREDVDLEIPARHLSRAVRQLVAAGWHVEAEGQRVRPAGASRLRVTSGIDWFDLHGSIDFGGLSATLPEILAAARKGDGYVTLGDGSRGLLPEEWLERVAPLVDLGLTEGEGVRFLPSQSTMIDALLADQPDVERDEEFVRLTGKLQSFQGIEPREQPAGFSGRLREYQRFGLGWLRFLEEFSFGGCLADDMGLGKTIQVLALLEERRTRPLSAGQSRRPSLVVVPRSLVQNWIEEAARFTPGLRVLDYTGLDRSGERDRFGEYDLIVTTYGTVRRDIADLQKVTFDYAILDEAQAIKNATSQSAKVCRLLRAHHRLAMSGTPVENHLGELWSLFEFLNPGMLGRSPASGAHLSGARDADAVELLARALRPFILRRTKEQVLKELPRKTEQTLYCELEGKQRKLYDQLRAHYRATLTQTIARVGLARARMHVLEALLRLRQAACHPGLVDKTRLEEGSAKLDSLLESLREVVDEGHKALVFSQFTSLLSIVRTQLDREGLKYEYLDGRTVKRADKVKRFQTDAECRIFLISIKAGGQGLNLTAADYVFILDPWWNPAVEAQAVDRAHRIGQVRPVFAYRLIARDTVEDKILELQRNKRRLAEAIISADAGVLRQLTAEDLQKLLS